MLRKTRLDQFRGADTLHLHLIGEFYYTTELLELARKAQATWLIDFIALHQRSPQIKETRKLNVKQCWQLQVQPDKSAFLTCSHQGKVILTEKIECINFPQDEIQLYLVNLILMLANQYEETVSLRLTKNV